MEFVYSDMHTTVSVWKMQILVLKIQNIISVQLDRWVKGIVKAGNFKLNEVEDDGFSKLNYSGVHIRMDKPRFMKQMAYFWPSLVGNKNAIRLQPFRLHFSIDCSFKMRYCMNFYLNWHRNYVRLKLKACF